MKRGEGWRVTEKSGEEFVLMHDEGSGEEFHDLYMLAYYSL